MYLTKLLKPVSYRTGSNPIQLDLKTLFFRREAFEPRGRFVEKPGHMAPSKMGGSITELSVTDMIQKAVRRWIELGASCTRKSIQIEFRRAGYP